jgi:hypothetical protein
MRLSPYRTSTTASLLPPLLPSQNPNSPNSSPPSPPPLPPQPPTLPPPPPSGRTTNSLPNALPVEHYTASTKPLSPVRRLISSSLEQVSTLRRGHRVGRIGCCIRVREKLRSSSMDRRRRSCEAITNRFVPSSSSLLPPLLAHFSLSQVSAVFNLSPSSASSRLPFSAPFPIDPSWRTRQTVGFVLDRLVGSFWTLLILLGLGKDARCVCSLSR